MSFIIPDLMVQYAKLEESDSGQFEGIANPRPARVPWVQIPPPPPRKMGRTVIRGT